MELIFKLNKMRRYRKYGFGVDQAEGEGQDERYNAAFRQVKRIKGFYVHLMVYVLVNAFVIIGNYNYDGQHEFWRWETFSTALFWGIGLVAHGLSVFGRSIFFTPDWEERKINEFMEKQKHQKWE